jgi:hypothetical protein
MQFVYFFMEDRKTDNPEFYSSKRIKDSCYFGRSVLFPLNITLNSSNIPTVQAARQTLTYTFLHSQYICSNKTQRREMYELLFQKSTSKLQCSAPAEGSRQLTRMFLLISKVNQVWFWHQTFPRQPNVHFFFKSFNFTEYIIIFTVSNSYTTGNLFVSSYTSARKSLIAHVSFENLQFLSWTQSNFWV